MGNFAGGKVTAAHSTAIEAARPLVAMLLRHPQVKKVGLGIIIRAASRTGQTRVKIMEEPACLLLKVRGSSAVQEIRVYGGNLALVRESIERFLA